MKRGNQMRNNKKVVKTNNNEEIKRNVSIPVKGSPINDGIIK